MQGAEAGQGQLHLRQVGGDDRVQAFNLCLKTSQQNIIAQFKQERRIDQLIESHRRYYAFRQNP
jgi:hypothetical protein